MKICFPILHPYVGNASNQLSIAVDVEVLIDFVLHRITYQHCVKLFHHCQGIFDDAGNMCRTCQVIFFQMNFYALLLHFKFHSIHIQIVNITELHH